MSAYALPGLFPPIQSSVPKETGNASTLSEKGEFSLRPLHKQDQVAAKSTVDEPVSMFSLSPYLLSPSKSDSDESKGNRIHVTEAKVDPVRLVASVTQSSRPKSSSGKKTQLRKRSSKDRLEESVKNSPGSDSSKGREGKDALRSFHDEAIEFALSISFNGRKYTAKRTMQRIMQLRDDLIAEMDDRRRWLLLRQSRDQTFSQHSSTPGDEYANVEIPEIPPLTGEEDGSGVGGSFVGRGFSMLHAMATSYVPVMERWLRNVLETVPQDSETLMNFLWEPLSHDSSVMGSPTNSFLSLAKLDSIKELVECATDSDTEDEWEG